MPNSESGPHALRFGPFEADLRTAELRKHGRRVRLPQQSFTALAMLATRPNELVMREVLCRRLWPSGTFVEYEQGLNAVINRLREALGDSASDPRFIETLPRRGYRFIAAIEPVEAVPAAAADAQSARGRESGSGRHPVRLAIAMAVALLVAATVVWLVGRRGTAEPLSAASRVVPFTSLMGEEKAPSFSPDGSQIAFAWNGGPGSGQLFDLFVKSVDAERTLQLTRHPSQSISPAWSPDGSRIAFARAADDASGVYMIPALGGAERRLATASFSSQTFMQIGWSPDGRMLSYSSIDGSGSNVIHLLSVDTLETRRLKPAPACWDAGAPAFSPDGTYLALVCTSSVAVYSIYIAPLDGSSPRLVKSMMGHPLGLAWSRDGSSLMVASDAGEGGSLWRLTLDGSITRLPFGEQGSRPTVAGTGAMAYVRGREDVNIWRIDLNASRPADTAIRLVASTRIDMTPQYSPNLERIAFQSNRSGAAEIWLADADGASPVRLTSSNGALTGSPSWCADGRRIAFDSRATGVSAIYIADVDEARPRKLETDQPNLALPVWSSDCRWIFASDGKSSVYRVPAAGGPALRFTTQPAYYTQVVGDRVVFNVKAVGGVTLWSKSIDGGAERALEQMPVLRYTDPWTVGPAGIYFVRSTSGDGSAVEHYDFGTRTTRAIGRLSRRPTALGGLGMTVSKDGRWLLYTQTDGAEADIMLSGQ